MTVKNTFRFFLIFAVLISLPAFFGVEPLPRLEVIVFSCMFVILCAIRDQKEDKT